MTQSCFLLRKTDFFPSCKEEAEYLQKPKLKITLVIMSAKMKYALFCFIFSLKRESKGSVK